ncbi:hypothetical protein [Leptolyngbya sp. GB1-A1]|uniref:hypothetical protein n=1 Tax=Leptolyngbya sp. GB1-A1 TaxID=2933908 RepID=UPI00329979EF
MEFLRFQVYHYLASDKSKTTSAQRMLQAGKLADEDQSTIDVVINDRQPDAVDRQAVCW